jgi:hypothetical protein
MLRAVRAGSLVWLVAACGTEPPTNSTGYSGRLTVATSYPAEARGSFAGLVVDRARVRVVRRERAVVDTSVAFPLDAASINIQVRVPLEARIERLPVSIELLGGSLSLFAGTATVDIGAEGTAPPARPTIPLSYVGPGANVASIRISPRDSVVSLGATLPLDVTARDASGAPVASFYLTWSASDPRLQVRPDGELRAPAARLVARVRARTPTGVADSTEVTVAPPAASLAIVGGNNQSGPVGTVLTLPLAVEARAADGLGVPQVAIRFRLTGGGAGPADTTVRTDAGGVARLAVRLGQVAGNLSFEATAAGIGAPVGFTLSATAGAPTSLLPTGGTGQIVAAGKPLPAPLGVRAEDQFGNPVPGLTIDWASVLGGAVPSPASSVTNGAGVAQTSVTVGTRPIANLITARVRATSVSYDFAAAVVAGPPATIVELQGSGPALGVAAVNLTGQVLDAAGVPVEGVPVTWQIVSGVGVFQAALTSSLGAGLLLAIFQPVGNPPMTIRAFLPTAGLIHDFQLTAASPASTVNLIGGTSQGGVVGKPLPQPIVAEARDASGGLLPGVPLTWSVPAGGGAFTPNPSVTGAQGTVAVSYTAGTVAGLHVGRVRHVATGAVTIGTWFVGPEALARFVRFGGDNQTATVGTRLTAELIALVADNFGNGLSDLQVNWSAPSGTFNTTSSTTDQLGLARVQFTPTALGPVQVTAVEPSSGAIIRFRVVGQ